MMINQTEGEDASEGTRLIYLKKLNHWLKSNNNQNMSENDVILLNTGWRFPLPSLKIKTITQANLLRRASTHNLPPRLRLRSRPRISSSPFILNWYHFSVPKCHLWIESSAFRRILPLHLVDHHQTTQKPRPRLGLRQKSKDFKQKTFYFFNIIYIFLLV